MSTKQYIDKNPQKKSLDLILQIRDIVNAYQEQGLDLTVRQTYYQLVSRNIIPNDEKHYNKVIGALKDGRLLGLIDWDAIVDRSRSINIKPYWSGPQELLRSAAEQYRRDRWNSQPFYLECWVEKEALAGVVSTAAGKYDVTSFACKGYPSITTMYDAAERMIGRRGKHCTILYLGDHDASGLDMVNNIENQMEQFGADVDVQRIALNMEQIEQYAPPPNPAKEDDRRYKEYAKKYGSYSWELDALPPDVLVNLIEENILLRLDKELYDNEIAMENFERNMILDIEKSI